MVVLNDWTGLGGYYTQVGGLAQLVQLYETHDETSKVSAGDGTRRT
jgi:hypothetical protein